MTFLSSATLGDELSPWELDNVELTTVGVDIGSATSQLMFARLRLERQGRNYSSRFEVVERELIGRSSVFLTPFAGVEEIDVDALEQFIERSFQDAGLSRDDVDTGAVLLTGVALERRNARAIANLFAEDAGKFVCATAGHVLEAVLAAHGAGAVSASARTGEAVVSMDVGGGTTKFALVDHGEICAALAVEGGGRLVSWQDDGAVERVEASAERFCRAAGVAVRIGDVLTEGERRRLGRAMARYVVSAAFGGGVPEPLAGDMSAGQRPDRIIVSGGVGQLLTGQESVDVGDLGPYLADALAEELADLAIPVEIAAEPIRATVVGASQFTVQLSGNTIYLGDSRVLPIHNVPVIAVRLPDVPPAARHVADEILKAARWCSARIPDQAPLGIALHWSGAPSYASLRSIAEGITTAQREAGDPVTVVALETDVAANLGSIMAEEFGPSADLVVIDGLSLAEFDYLDVGERIDPANVVPVVIKSLIFTEAGRYEERVKRPGRSSLGGERRE